MREDQKKRVESLSVDLMDVFLIEADPINWAGSGVTPSDLDKETRGARNWDMKNANQAGALLVRVLDLQDRISGVPTAHAHNYNPISHEEAEAEMKRYEKKAKEIIKSIGVSRGTS